MSNQTQSTMEPSLQLDWEMVGTGDEAVCLIHPLGMERGFWQGLVSRLSADHRCLLVDLPGHGRSPLPSVPYSMTDVAQSVAAILIRADATPAHLVGASMGGMAALALAALYPRTASSLVLADTTARYREQLRAMWAERAEAARSAGLDPLLDDLLDVWFSPGALADDGPGVAYVRDQLSTVSPEAYALACEALAEADLEDVTTSVDVPTLVVAGDDDILADDCRRLARDIPGASLTWLPSGRHGAPLELADQFTATVRAWLGELKPG